MGDRRIGMTTIKTTCGHCGDIHLTPDDVALELRPGGREGDYRFKCPSCTEQQRRPANSRVVSVLLATGVAYEVVNPDPITEAEIMAFTTALDSEPDPLRLLAG
ncbi:MAG: hypothetical protein DWQ40_01455 [Actinobacteria bacterium]|nr:MAG: hypothetical protein DWQ40_01455 [Actinomycetota bacterium]